MSALLDQLLEDTRRMEVAASRKNDGLIKSVLRIAEPVTRADKIIAAGNAERVQYRAKNPTADSAMVYGAQIGHLHGEVRRLCAELEQFTNAMPVCVPCSIEIRANADIGSAIVTCGYESGSDGDNLVGVWLRGVEITQVLSDSAIGTLEEAMRAEVAAMREAENIEAAISRAQ